MHALGVEPFMVGHIKKRLDNIRTHLCRTGITRDAKTVSAAGNFDIKATFNLAQVFVKLTAEVGKTTVVGGYQDKVLRYLYSVQWRVITPVVR